MPKKPALGNYPRLHALLRQDTVANAQFNACLSAQQSSFMEDADAGSVSAMSLAKCEKNLAETLQKYTDILRTTSRVRRLITLLGTVIEPQVALKPYTQDLEERSSYEITFNASQIRQALGMYWDLLTREAEDKISGRMDDVDLLEEEKE